MAIYDDREKLARDLFSHFTPSPGFDSLSWPMQERWRELAEYVAGRECPECKAHAGELEETENQLIEAEKMRDHYEERARDLEDELDTANRTIQRLEESQQ